MLLTHIFMISLILDYRVKLLLSLLAPLNTQGYPTQNYQYIWEELNIILFYNVNLFDNLIYFNNYERFKDQLLLKK